MLVIVKSRERDWFTLSGAERSGAERNGAARRKFVRPGDRQTDRRTVCLKVGGYVT
jgi:hypothetical protein